MLGNEPEGRRTGASASPAALRPFFEEQKMTTANRNPVPPGRDLRLKRMLAQAAKDPSVVLDDRRFLKPYACEAYFEICDDKALREPEASMEYASTAVRLAERIGDRHLMNLAQGVLVHAHIASKKWLEAEEILAAYQEHAMGCCEVCQSEFFRRRGDLLVETRRSSKALKDLLRSIEHLGPGLDADRDARIRFVRGIAYHFDEDPDRALDDAGQALLELSLDSPRGYFMDALAFISCFLVKAEPEHFEKAKDFLDRFRERIKGVKDWTDVRERLIWVEGGVSDALQVRPGPLRPGRRRGRGHVRRPQARRPEPGDPQDARLQVPGARARRGAEAARREGRGRPRQESGESVRGFRRAAPSHGHAGAGVAVISGQSCQHRGESLYGWAEPKTVPAEPARSVAPARAGESRSPPGWELELHGRAHLQGVQAPQLPEIPGIRVFTPQQRSEESLKGKTAAEAYRSGSVERWGPRPAVLLADCRTEAGELPAGTEAWVRSLDEGGFEVERVGVSCPPEAVGLIFP